MDEGAEKPIYVLGLGGSLRRPSESEVALRMALRGAEDAGAEIDIITAEGLELPLYPSPKMDEHPAVVRLLAAARRADGLILASPAYHGTMSGALKNALDYFQFLAHDVPPYLDGRAIGVLSTGAGTQAAVQTVNALRDVAQSAERTREQPCLERRLAPAGEGASCSRARAASSPRISRRRSRRRGMRCTPAGARTSI